MTRYEQFKNHAFSCEMCSQVDIESPRSLSHACIEGAELLRNALSEYYSELHKKKQKAIKRQFLTNGEGKVYKTTSTKLKQIMKYKE